MPIKSLIVKCKVRTVCAETQMYCTEGKIQYFPQISRVLCSFFTPYLISEYKYLDVYYGNKWFYNLTVDMYAIMLPSRLFSLNI